MSVTSYQGGALPCRQKFVYNQATYEYIYQQSLLLQDKSYKVAKQGVTIDGKKKITFSIHYPYE